MLVAVTIRGNDFHDHSHQRKLLNPTDATGEICDTAKRLFVELRDGQTPLRLLGVSLTDLTHGEAAQMSLFEDEQRERSRKLDRPWMPSGTSMAQTPSCAQGRWAREVRRP